MIAWSLNQVTAPTAEPVTRGEEKSHANVTISGDDDLVDFFITAARERLETMTRRAIMPQTFDLVLDRFPLGSRVIHIPKSPLISATAITYFDSAGDAQSITDYQVDTLSEPGRICPAIGESWPTAQAGRLAAVTIRFACGFEDSGSPTDTSHAGGVPAQLKKAINLLATYYYDNRAAAVHGPAALEIPHGVEAIAGSFRVPHFEIQR